MKTQIVYVVTDAYEHNRFLGVFGTREKAEEFIAASDEFGADDLTITSHAIVIQE